MEVSAEAQDLITVLRQATDVQVANAVERLLHDGLDFELNRINVLDFARKADISEERVIAAFLHATRVGIFELFWNVLCPGCGGVLDASTTLKVNESGKLHLCTLRGRL